MSATNLIILGCLGLVYGAGMAWWLYFITRRFSGGEHIDKLLDHDKDIIDLQNEFLRQMNHAKRSEVSPYAVARWIVDLSRRLSLVDTPPSQADLPAPPLANPAAPPEEETGYEVMTTSDRVGT